MWFGHINRRPIDYVIKKIGQIKKSQIIRGRKRPKKIIRNIIKTAILII